MWRLPGIPDTCFGMTRLWLSTSYNTARRPSRAWGLPHTMHVIKGFGVDCPASIIGRGAIGGTGCLVTHMPVSTQAAQPAEYVASIATPSASNDMSGRYPALAAVDLGIDARWRVWDSGTFSDCGIVSCVKLFGSADCRPRHTLNMRLKYSEFSRGSSASSMPASFLAKFFLYVSCICRCICMRCAWGDPAPCMDSVR